MAESFNKNNTSEIPSRSTMDIYEAALDELQDQEDEEKLKQRQQEVNFARTFDFSSVPIGVVTTEDIKNRRPPAPVGVQVQKAHGVRSAHAGEIRYRPRQPRSFFAFVLGLAAAVLVIIGILYAALVFAGRLPEPRIFMFGASTNAGKIMQGSFDTSALPNTQEAELKDQSIAKDYIQFRTQITSIIDPVLESYALLGDELAKGGVPNLGKIKELNNKAQAQVQTAQSNLDALEIPKSVKGDPGNYLAKIYASTEALLRQAENTSLAVQKTVGGEASAFADAGLAAQNMIRNRQNIYADFRRADNAIGIIKPEDKQDNQDESKDVDETKNQ